MFKLQLVHYYLVAAFMLWFGASSAQTIAINEVVSSNQSTVADEDNSFEDWIELYNYGTTAVNLNGFGLSDDTGRPFKWVFPNVSLAPNQYLLVWASDKNRIIPGSPLHTNFKISASGEPIVLTRADSTQVDLVTVVALLANVAYGRQPDGTGAWKVLASATPKASNGGSSGIVTAPVFSHASGLYKEEFNLLLSHPNPLAVIIYTLDGSEPDITNLTGTTYQYKNTYPTEVGDPFGPFLTATYSSKTYTAPVKIANRSAEPDKYARMNTRQHPVYTPANPVRKGVIVRAKAFVGVIGSATVSRNFFVWPQGNPFDIPIVSLQTSENNLFDYEKGVYTAGKDFDTWRTKNPDNNQWYRPEWGNYWRSGKEWEYPVHVEIFEPENFTSVVSKNGGFRIHGNNSRALAIKSLRLYARDEGNFEFDLFDEKVTDATKPDNKEFKRIMLRGEGTGGSVYYDVVFNRLMQPFFSGVARIKPAIHFINGEYWGITAIRDRFDEHHYALHYGLNPDNIVSVDCGANNCELDAGEQSDYVAYNSMRDYIRTNDMSDAVKFAKADSLLSMESFIDHMILEIFAANDSYERTYWKVRTKENNGYGDGKWRMNIKDFEASFKTNVVWFTKWADVNNSINESLFGHLLKNEGFKRQFINRYADLMNTGFKADRFKAIIDTTLVEVAPYLAEDANRIPRDNFYKSTERQKLISWAETRPAAQRDTIRAYFNLNGTFDLKLDVSSAAGGFVKVNTVNIAASTPGVAQNTYPWTGIYFQQIPVTLKAIAKPGYKFSHWSGDASGTIDSIVLTATNNVQIAANFVKDSLNKAAVYFWLIDNKVPNDSPLQVIPATYAVNNLTASLQYTSCLAGYPFNSQHADWRKASIERRNAPTEINYRPGANNNVKFADANIRGIQVKQPFRKNGLENTLTFHLPTINLEKINVSFAAETDGAAERLLIDYWNGQQWTAAGLKDSVFTLGSAYALAAVDFSQVSIADNNPDFKVRIRFDGSNMEEDSGLRVHFNNVAVDGEEKIVSGLPSVSGIPVHTLTAYPNPAQNDLTIASDEAMKSITIFNMYGQLVKTVNDAGESYNLSLETLPVSVYFVRVQWQNQEKTIRVIKQ